MYFPHYTRHTVRRLGVQYSSKSTTVRNSQWCRSIKELNSHKTNLKEVLDALRIVTVALTADALDFLDLSCLTCTLNILKMDFRVLAKVDNGSQEVEQTWKKHFHIRLAYFQNIRANLL